MASVEELRTERAQMLSRMRDIERELRNAEKAAFVQVQFFGYNRTYTYQLTPGEPVLIGDYVAVYSPSTDQTELVRVVALGRGSWQGPYKIAKRILWSVTE